MSRAPWPTGTRVHVLDLDPQYGTCLIAAVVTACTPRGHDGWTVTVRTSSGRDVPIHTSRTGHSDYLTSAADLHRPR